MKYVLEYKLAPGGLAKVQANFMAHRERLLQFNAAGTLYMAGPIGNPPEGALAVFASRESAEAFVSGDPFVINGVVGEHHIREWQEVLFSPTAGVGSR
jgi:uncharacterized protein YciI